MKLSRMTLFSLVLVAFSATVASACPDGTGARCGAHAAHARHPRSPVKAENSAGATALAVRTTANAPAHPANPAQRCQVYGPACDSAPGASASANRGSCCEDGASASHTAHATVTPASAAPARASRPTAKRQSPESEAPAFGPLFLARRTLML
jgi:cell division septation protein DedD